MQFILHENKELQEIPKDKCKPVEYPISTGWKMLLKYLCVWMERKTTGSVTMADWWLTWTGKDKGSFFQAYGKKTPTGTVFEYKYYISQLPGEKAVETGI